MQPTSEATPGHSVDITVWCGDWCLAQRSMSGQAKLGLKDLLLEDIGARQRVLVWLQVFLQGCVHLDLEMHMQSGLLDCELAMQMVKTTLQCRVQEPSYAQG